jgi:lipid II:glycine glycyltransferase (peptidoglycan interpeptide bridge formation enzyme)
MKSQPRKELEALVETFQDDFFVAYGYGSSGETDAVASYVVTGDTVLYQMNGSTERGRRDFATCLVVWEGILEGKRRGCQWFDFDGIFDGRFARAQKSWQGFSRFKVGFGGHEVTYLGSFNKWLPFLKK